MLVAASLLRSGLSATTPQTTTPTTANYPLLDAVWEVMDPAGTAPPEEEEVCVQLCTCLYVFSHTSCVFVCI